MSLLLDEDYDVLREHNLTFEEDEGTRFLIFRNFPLPAGVYVAEGQPRETVDVLYVIPADYNTSGGDMFWVSPQLARADGQPIPAINGSGEDSRTYGGVEFMRWSRHWNNPGVTWKPKADNIRTIVDRISWAFKHPTAERS